jgi:hypothetical protein
LGLIHKLSVTVRYCSIHENGLNLIGKSNA